MVVFSRTALGALMLLPLALRSGQFGTLRPVWRWVVAFAVLEMIVPWGLLSNAEQHLPSSLPGLLIAAVPIIGVVIARLTGGTGSAGTERLSLRRWAGLLTGLAGVAVLAAPHLAGGHAWPIAEVLLVAVGYGPTRAMVFTYVNPAVAVAGGVLVLGEPFTVTIAAAFVLILTGCVLATARRRSGTAGQGRERDQPVAAPPAGRAGQELSMGFPDSST